MDDKQKIIFLDIDGVLNTPKNMMDAIEKGIFPKGNIPMQTVSKDCVRRLRNIVEITDAKIVISSTWRMTMNAVWRAFAWCGWDNPPIIGKTGVGNSRGMEIEDWLKKHPVKNFVIIDDDDSDIHQKEHLVQTQNEIGLTDEDCQLAINILQSA